MMAGTWCAATPGRRPTTTRCGGLAALCLLAGGCVEINPRWDGPVDAAVAHGSESGGRGESSGSGESAGGSWGDEMSTDAASDESARASSEGPDGASSEGSGSDGTSSDGASSTGDATPVSCPGNQAECDGVCRQVHNDERACGEQCIDCTARFGEDAKCTMGECRDDD